MTVSKPAAEAANDVMTAIQANTTFYDNNAAARRIQAACDQAALNILARFGQSLENHRLIADNDPLVIRLIEEQKALTIEVEANLKSGVKPQTTN